MNNQQVLAWDQVANLPSDGTLIWTTARLFPLVEAHLPFNILAHEGEPQSGISRLVVIGGGSLIDRSKFWKWNCSKNTWLCAIPSIWGSGAEASSVAIRTEHGCKKPYIDDSFLPDARSVWPLLANLVSTERARWGFGDTWAHALEGFLSPLGSEESRKVARKFLHDDLLPQSFEADAAWFNLSARACHIQICSGVGLVHGIAHELELKVPGFGHARLCSALLWPVFYYNCLKDSKLNHLYVQYDLNPEAIGARVRTLFRSEDFDFLLPTLEREWGNILRNPLTRINCVLVRPNAIDFFLNREFEK